MLRTIPEKVDPRHTALIVIDMQNDFLAPEGWFVKECGVDVKPMVEIVPRLNRLIDSARAAGVLVVFVRATYDVKYLSPVHLERHARVSGRPTSEKGHLREGSWGWDFYGVKPGPGDVVINKHRYSAFIHTELEAVLKARGIQTLVISGVASEVCCESTARDGYMLDYYIVWPRECTATDDPKAHVAALQRIDKYFGVVTSADDVMAAWQKTLAPAPRVAEKV
jgi:ureidoacrylate peracid hydrolase